MRGVCVWPAALLVLLTAAAPTFGADSALGLLRADRRAALRASVAAAAARGEPARIGLLVIPVDFADARLPDDWLPAASLAPRLVTAADPGALASYFEHASQGRTALDIVIAPLVRLPGDRLDYSDRDLNGFTRTRRLASEALGFVRDTGLDFRLLDLDGPDGLPGSGDDDGEVDGVLILHAAPGLENDGDDGLIMPLAFFLEEPVTRDGVSARSYAVASLRSGLGVWAHETAHLLGLEDRYDPFLPSTAHDLAGRGGLGVFSLMAAGAWGSGDGADPALPDAYSCAQVGWLDVVDVRGDESLFLPAKGERVAWRIWEYGESGPEYFLLESRGDDPHYDPALPEPQLLVYHVDGTLAEGEQSSGVIDDRHLRVRLVEADGDGALARGEDRGTPADPFPGSGGVVSWTARSYDGPIDLALASIVPTEAGVILDIEDAASPRFTVELGFAFGASPALALAVRETGVPAVTLRATIRVVSDPAWGRFVDAPGGEALSFDLAPGGEAGLWVPATAVLWNPDSAPPPGASTRFSLRLRADGVDETAYRVHEWQWSEDPDPLDFRAAWPGSWSSSVAGVPGTAWRLLSDPGGSGGYALACNTALTVGDWPTAVYDNGADATLLTPPLPAGSAVRVVHRVRVDLIRPGVAGDGALARAILPDGGAADLAPVDRYPGAVDPSARHALGGLPSFAVLDGADPDLDPWRVDVFVLPEAPGPVRLALRLASDSAWREGGWLVRDMTLADPATASAFPVWRWSGGDGEAYPGPTRTSPPPPEPVLAWIWPWPEYVTLYRVESSADEGATWTEGWRGLPGTPQGQPFYLDDSHLGALAAYGPRQRLLLRVIAETVEFGPIASRPVARHADDGPTIGAVLGRPWPNPAAGPLRMMVTVPQSVSGASLDLYDLRGRRLRRWPFTAGTYLHLWDARDGDGNLLPSGAYLLLLEAGGRTQSRKVVILR